MKEWGISRYVINTWSYDSMGCTLDEVLNDVNTKRSAYIRAKREVEQIDAEREVIH
jgi:hypothetical protein